ncbi:MAG: PAS domain S-box protein, partial [Candidatus Hydrogenedentota bacterium]
MPWQYTPYTIPLIVAGSGSGVLALYIWRRRHSLGNIAIALLMLGASIWSLAYALQLASADLRNQIFWSKVEYLGIVVVPVAGLCFALQYTGRGERVTPRSLALLSIIPLATVVLVWTNEGHGLIWNNIRLENLGTFSVKVSNYGGWFWLHTAYCYSLFLVGTLLIIELLIYSHGLYRGQASALLIFALAPWVGNALYVFRLSPFPHLDLTPFGFTVSGLSLVWGLFHFRLVDLVPVAQEKIIESMDDSVIVLDAQSRIIEMNPAAQYLMDLTVSEAIGQPIEQALSALTGQLDLPRDETSANMEIALVRGDSQRFYEVRLSSLVDHIGFVASKVVVLHDITERKRMEEELQQHRTQLERQVRERTAELRRTIDQLLQEISERKRIEETLRLSEERYNRILDSCHDMICVVDENAKLLYSNRSLHENTGYTDGEGFSPGLSFEKVHPDDREKIANLFQRLMNGEPVRGVEYRGIHKSGETRWVESNADPIHWPGTEKAVVNVLRDVTERKRMKEALKESEERYRTLI